MEDIADLPSCLPPDERTLPRMLHRPDEGRDPALRGRARAAAASDVTEAAAIPVRSELAEDEVGGRRRWRRGKRRRLCLQRNRTRVYMHKLRYLQQA